jgi:hypothetical protein
LGAEVGHRLATVDVTLEEDHLAVEDPHRQGRPGLPGDLLRLLVDAFVFEEDDDRPLAGVDDLIDLRLDDPLAQLDREVADVLVGPVEGPLAGDVFEILGQVFANLVEILAQGEVREGSDDQLLYRLEVVVWPPRSYRPEINRSQRGEVGL